MKRRRTWNRADRRELPVFALLLVAAALICLVVVGFRTAAMNREVEALERSVYRLDSGNSNLQMCIDTYYDMDRIEQRARRLGMQEAQEGQVRAVRVPGVSTQVSVSAFTADAQAFTEADD